MSLSDSDDDSQEDYSSPELTGMARMPEKRLSNSKFMLDQNS